MLGIILVVVGAVFLLSNLGIISSSAWGIIWPLILIAIGLGVMVKKSKQGCGFCGMRGYGQENEKK